jgi:LAO/AO transport system kinase
VSEAPPETLAEGLARGITTGDRHALARALSAVENQTDLAEPLLRRLYPIPAQAKLVGITGPPGTGKSTLVNALIRVARGADRSVAVVAVDPSSPITGGALLGDRVRMQEHAGDPGVFIRSMAARGHAGGLAAATASATEVLAAAGFDLILIETVGTGQGEVEIAASADVTVVLEAPDAGDEVQAIKAGLLEVADVVVVNKGDRPGAARAAAQLRAMLGAGRTGSAAGTRRPEVLITTATTGQGVAELPAVIDRRVGGAAREGGGARRARAEDQVWSILGARVRERLLAGDLEQATTATLAAVAEHQLDPYTAADRLLALVDGTTPAEPTGRSTRARSPAQSG